jgi:phosphoglycolate phosphatase
MKSPQPKGHAPATFKARPDASRRIILFDIDGTLVLTGGAGLRAMTRAFEELFKISDAFQGVPMPGRTDHWILSDAALVHDVPAPDLERFHDVYISHLARELHEPGPRKGVMPGVRPLLERLAGRDDAYLALLTGNYERAARMKLEYFDLWKYFACGAFGDGAPDRNSLLPRALARIRDCGGPTADPDAVVVIGDTPLDVECAAAAGARSIAVATGSHGVEELRAAGADTVFADLSDADAVVEAIWRKRLGVEPSPPARAGSDRF